MNRISSLPRTPRGGRVFRNARFTGQTNRRSTTINPEKFVNRATAEVTPEVFVPRHDFDHFPFDARILANLKSRGYVQPTPIQDEAIVPILAGRDLVGLANTGTGKTAAFALPILQRLITGKIDGLVLVIAPTRELAGQIDEEFKAFARGLNLQTALLVGGASLRPQIMALGRQPKVVIGTPGRIKDLVNQRALTLGSVKTLVLDEADRMLDMGFIRDINFLIDLMPTERQTLCFSATMNPEIDHLMQKILRQPITVSVRRSATNEHIDQDIVRAVSKEHKLELLTEMLGQPGFEKVLVFGQTKYGVQRLANNLTKAGIKAEAIHGNKSQPQRQRALEAFKQNRVQVLVATDVAARGLDIPNVSHVINFDQPNTYDDYVHRIGRTGRAGNRGKALTFVA
jgi:superfamily II DNA/RNA helicase